MIKSLWIIALAVTLDDFIPDQLVWLLDQFTVLRRMNMNAALDEILDSGFRAWASGLVFAFRGKPYGIYFVKFESTFHENPRGEWN